MLRFDQDNDIGYRLHAEMKVDLPLPQVFEFFADAHKLDLITPPWLKFSILTPPPIEMQEGLRLNYRLSLHGIPIRWQSEISSWEPPYRFVDRQTRGPYKIWHHEHILEESGGQTLVRDNVHYLPRGGPLIHRWLVRPDLEKIFGYRQQMLEKIFQSMAKPELVGKSLEYC